MISLLSYNILVLALFHKLNRRVFITNAFSLSFYWCQVTLTLSKQDISLRRTVPASPEGLHQRES